MRFINLILLSGCLFFTACASPYQARTPQEDQWAKTGGEVGGFLGDMLKAAGKGLQEGSKKPIYETDCYQIGNQISCTTR